MATRTSQHHRRSGNKNVELAAEAAKETAKETAKEATNKPVKEPADRPTSDRSTSVELAQTVAGWDVVDLAPWQPELAAAASDLATAVGVAWTVDPDESVVALCRIVARLAQLSPTATSPLAAHLIDALALARS